MFHAPRRGAANDDFGSRRNGGFTLMELLLVLALIALLASLVSAVVTGSIHRARESTLKENLFTMRKAIDDYYADNGGYPAELGVLVEKRYIRKIPVDPFTELSDSWILVRTDDDGQGKGSGIIDVHSGSEEMADNGVPYKEW
jgi:general secretion pathway protein G